VTLQVLETDRHSSPGQLERTLPSTIVPQIGNLRCGTRFAGRAPVARSARLEDVELLHLPRPPRPANVDLAGSDHPNSEVVPVMPPVRRASPIAPVPLLPALPSSHRPEPIPKRPPLEGLLQRAENLARSMTISDPGGRLLQIALIRRDHTLLDAVVRSVDAAYARQRCATWRPTSKRAATVRATPGYGTSRRRGTTERPVMRPSRSR
jgi:hypothetical protein